MLLSLDTLLPTGRNPASRSSCTASFESWRFMYLDFYEFESNPFHPSRDPRFYYASRSHVAAMSELDTAVAGRVGLILITGASSTGKTSLLEAAMRRDWPEGVIPIALTNPLFPFSRLLHELHERLFPELVPPATQNEMVSQIRRELQRKTTHHWNVVLLLDEAQHLPTDTAAQLGRLLKIRNPNGHAIQIVLFGQPELEDRLEEKRLEHLREIIGARSELQPLDIDETLPYVEHRIRQAAAKGTTIALPFEHDALLAIGKRAAGRPGTINRFCHEALMAGARFRERPVSLETVQSVLPPEVKNATELPRWLPAAAAVVVAFGAIVLALMFGPSFRSVDAQTADLPVPDGATAMSTEANATTLPQGTNLDPPQVLDSETDESSTEVELEQRVGNWVDTMTRIDQESGEAVTWVATDRPATELTARGRAKAPANTDTSFEQTSQASASPSATQLATPAQGSASPPAAIPRDGGALTSLPATTRIASNNTTDREPIVSLRRDSSASESLSNDEQAADNTGNAVGTPSLSIVSYPIAEIWIDGENIGTTPIANYPVSVGKHFIEAVVHGRRRVFTEVLRERENRKMTLRLDERPGT